jgi:hypothetical protein
VLLRADLAFMGIESFASFCSYSLPPPRAPLRADSAFTRLYIIQREVRNDLYMDPVVSVRYERCSTVLGQKGLTPDMSPNMMYIVENTIGE